MTPEERETRIEELIDKHRLTPAEAEFTVALEEGEVDGDVVALAPTGSPYAVSSVHHTREMDVHRTVRLSHRGEDYDIDEGLAPLIQEIWRAGIETVDSCQDSGESIAGLAEHLPHIAAQSKALLGRSRIGFPSDDAVCAFAEALANSGPRDEFYVRMVHWSAPGAWSVHCRFVDFAVEDAEEDASDNPASRFFLDDWVIVYFPRTDIPEMMRRMKVFNSGELPSPGPIDWSSIEFDNPDE